MKTNNGINLSIIDFESRKTFADWTEDIYYTLPHHYQMRFYDKGDIIGLEEGKAVIRKVSIGVAGENVKAVSLYVSLLKS